MEYVMSKLLWEAREGKYAVPAICVSNMESVLACFIAADRTRSPIIIQSAYSEMEPQMIGYRDLAGIIRTFGDRYTDVPYAIHLDHGMSEKECMDALEGSFPSVMFDGSSLSFEENMEVTARIKKAAGQERTVEAEVGKVGGEEGGSSDGSYHIIKSDPDQLREFVLKTGVDAIAVSIGNIHGCHGIEKQIPELDFRLLERLKDACEIPLVLHGASGIPDEDIHTAVSLGICKINYYTQLYNVYMDCVKQYSDCTMEECMGNATRVLAGEIEKLIKVCGSAGKA
ncbi:MAG TPA: class II fructose-bisphosphate aldolase [Candidatus Mediterraneibacter merdipullorum]|nr:class II fructose-bisphosphate aldolase [Candidatus Mediterraneibacter merdipullorum]